MTKVNSLFFLSMFGVFVFFLSYYITSYIRSYSLRNNVIDVPNERSSHTIPTPTGGGVAIAMSMLLSSLLFIVGTGDLFLLSLGLSSGVLIIGIVGWVDIHHEVPVMKRAILYLCTSAWAVLVFGGIDTLTFGDYSLKSVWLASSIAIVAVSWLVNLYNFMDGTDGLAAIQAITSAFCGGVFFIVSGKFEAGILCLAIIFSSSAFLIWNWAPAKIFMGDVGSCSIGFAFGILAIYGEKTAVIPVVVWLILLSIFISDASFTLFKRILAGETWYRAHNTHAYQRLVQMGISHARLAQCLLAFNICITGPSAYLAWVFPSMALNILIGVYSGTFCLWLYIHKRFQSRYQQN